MTRAQMRPLLAMTLILLAFPAEAETLLGKASVIDGDTLEIHGQRIRLHGVDAPESGQVCQDGAGQGYRCGQRAAFALSERIGEQTVVCDGDRRDRYKRLIAVCTAGGADLGAWMVRDGWAMAYSRYSRDYEELQIEAQKAERGLWAGVFEAPWDWRKHH